MPHLTSTGFLLSRSHQDTPSGLSFELWLCCANGPVRVTLSGQEAVMFVRRTAQARGARRAPVSLRDPEGAPVDAVYFARQQDLHAERRRLSDEGEPTYEADVKPVERFLMERFITSGLAVTGPAMQEEGVVHYRNPWVTPADVSVKFKVLSLDIETVGLDGPLLSIAGSSSSCERAFLVEQGAALSAELPDHVSVCQSEAECIFEFCRWVREFDPDVLVGWNVVDFDLSYLAERCQKLQIPFALGRGGARADVLTPRSGRSPKIARVPGRVVLDGIATLRSATIFFESYGLEDVAQRMFSRGKHIDKTPDIAEEIARLAKQDPEALARYNLQDCRLVLEIFTHARLLEFAVERQRLTGLSLDRQGGSVVAFDQLYLPRLHRAGFVAPTTGDRLALGESPGGFVMNSAPGLYRNVIVLDFKSLYPSIIRTFLVDPLGLSQPGEDPVPGFDGATFSRQAHILPSLIETLWKARDQAKRDDNPSLSQAIKIMMNSFYGVLGTPGCRFFDSRLVSSITKRGHEILARSRDFISARGLRVIYGDTDSLFVHLGEKWSADACHQQGAGLAQDLTEFFRERLDQEMGLSSHLELEYEVLYQRFLMPTIRGSEVGTKKRYAGMVLREGQEPEIVFKGLEAVRSDWTPLARNFQKELFRRVFLGEPHEDFVRKTVRDLRSGACDELLAYRKRLRKPLNEYTRNVPPHVRAARMLRRTPKTICYVMTTNGPEPQGERKSPFDYDHYEQRQLAPCADSLLVFLGTSFHELTGLQMKMF